LRANTPRAFKVGDRFDFLDGNFFDLRLGPRTIRISPSLGHIVHGEGVERAKQLLRRAFDALKPGGILLIAEFIPNENRTRPRARPDVRSEHVRRNARRRRLHDGRVSRAWLKEAGFKRVTTLAANRPVATDSGPQVIDLDCGVSAVVGGIELIENMRETRVHDVALVDKFRSAPSRIGSPYCAAG